MLPIENGVNTGNCIYILFNGDVFSPVKEGGSYWQEIFSSEIHVHMNV